VADDQLSPQLVDLITETLVWTDGSTQRAEALLQIVSCAVEAIHWRLEPEGCPPEELSAQAVVLAAADHLHRMTPSSSAGSSPATAAPWAGNNLQWRLDRSREQPEERGSGGPDPRSS